MAKKEKILVITNIITGILMLVFGGFGIYQMNSAKDITSELKKCENVNKNTNVVDKDDSNSGVDDKNNDKEIQSIEGTLVYSNGNESIKLYLTAEKELKLISTELGESVVAKKVTKTYDVKAGQSDTCEGNRWIISQNENDEFVALSIDSLSCGNEVKTINLTNEFKNKKISNATYIYQEEKFVNMYEPNSFKVFTLNGEGKSVEITDILDK